YAGAYYTLRAAAAPAGTVQSSGTLMAGLGPYTAVGTPDRWGDYSGAAIDPSDGSTLWIFNEYARTRRGPWGTHYGSFALTNTAPVLNGANNLTGINEDPSTNPGTLVSALIAGQASDADGNPLGIAVTAADNTHGTWQYTLDGSTFQAIPAV